MYKISLFVLLLILVSCSENEHSIDNVSIDDMTIDDDTTDDDTTDGNDEDDTMDDDTMDGNDDDDDTTDDDTTDDDTTDGSDNDDTTDEDDDNDNDTTDDDLSGQIVEIDVKSRANRPFLDRSSVLLRLDVKDGDLANRDVVVRITESDIAPKGALILTTGGFGGGFYGGSTEKKATIDFALSNGLQVLEIRWDGGYGWGTNVEGVGYTRALRAYSKLVEWLKENSILNPSLMICHGGSGGSMQIAYGLANYNLEESIDYAILMAGPPTSDLDRAIYGSEDDIVLWPDGLLSFGKTDYIQGWRNNGDYCANRAANPPNFVIETLEAESLVNDSAIKDYNYETTKLYFLNTDDETNSDEQGFLYYNRVTSEKDWTFFPQETSHNVGGIEVGAMKIREILNDIID